MKKLVISCLCAWISVALADDLGPIQTIVIKNTSSYNLTSERFMPTSDGTKEFEKLVNKLDLINSGYTGQIQIQQYLSDQSGWYDAGLYYVVTDGTYTDNIKIKTALTAKTGILDLKHGSATILGNTNQPCGVLVCIAMDSKAGTITISNK